MIRDCFRGRGTGWSDVADSGQYSATNTRRKRPGRYRIPFDPFLRDGRCHGVSLFLDHLGSLLRRAKVHHRTMEHRGHEAKQYGESNDFLRYLHCRENYSMIS